MGIDARTTCWTHSPHGLFTRRHWPNSGHLHWRLGHQTDILHRTLPAGLPQGTPVSGSVHSRASDWKSNTLLLLHGQMSSNVHNIYAMVQIENKNGNSQQFLKEFAWLIYPWASYKIRKIAGCTCTGNAENAFTATAGYRIPTCVRHIRHTRAVMQAVSFDAGCGENVPGIPGACATRNFTCMSRGPYISWLMHCIGVDTIIWFAQCHWSNPEGHWQIKGILWHYPWQKIWHFFCFVNIW